MAKKKLAKITPSKIEEKAAPAAAQKPEERLFYSQDGEDIRVPLPDGRVALVGEEPRVLPRAFHKEAMKRGCLIAGANMPKLDLSVPTELDQEARNEAIKDAIREALDADSEAEGYEAAYGEAFNENEEPSVRWIEKRLGFNISAGERDKAWAEVQREAPEPDDDESKDDPLE